MADTAETVPPVENAASETTENVNSAAASASDEKKSEDVVPSAAASDAETAEEPIVDTTYEIANLRRPQSVADLGRETMALHHIFGNDMSKNGNLYLIGDEDVMYATSTAVVFQNTNTGFKKYLMPIDEGGVGTVTVHPSR